MSFSSFEPVDLSRATNEQLALVNACFADNAPEIWRDMAELNFVAMRCNASLDSIPDSSLVAVAVTLVHQLASNLGGRNVYFANGLISMKTEKNALIAKEYTGNNVGQLAQKYRVSEMRIRQIIKGDADSKKAARIAAPSTTRTKTPLP